MTQEEKELLLKDLCARLPYGVKVKCASEILTLNVNWLKVFQYHLDEIKPYLRPMSSLTNEEREYLSSIENANFYPAIKHSGVDYLNSIHVDYRGLIPMGLALEAPKDMYNI